jgi:hypothetical protein
MKLFLSLLLATAVNVDAGYNAGIDMKSACGYAVLSKSGISTVPNSNVVGNIGVSPITAAAMTGFSMAEDGGGQFALSS